MLRNDYDSPVRPEVSNRQRKLKWTKKKWKFLKKKELNKFYNFRLPTDTPHHSTMVSNFGISSAFVLIAAIIALGAAQPIQMKYNETHRWSVKPFSWVYYQFTMANLSVPARVQVNCTKGDVFIFASINKLPTLTDYIWKDTNEGMSRELVIPSDASTIVRRKCDFFYFFIFLFFVFFATPHVCKI